MLFSNAFFFLAQRTNQDETGLITIIIQIDMQNEPTEVIEGEKLAYSWQYKDYKGNTKVTFELTPSGNQTRLKLSHVGLETFPADQPDFDRENFVVGWTWIIGTSLKEYLEKTRF